MHIRKIMDPATGELLAERMGWDDTMQSGERISTDVWDSLLQVSLIQNETLETKTYAKHRHLPLSRSTVGTSEAWVVVRGYVLVTVCDLRGESLAIFRMSAGDVFVSHRGWHGYEIMPGARVVEVKNGPYYGRHDDKEIADADRG
jgi:hypothetical protein